MVTIPDFGKNPIVIDNEGEALRHLKVRPHKPTQKFLKHHDMKTFWIEVDVFSGEGHHSGTHYYIVVPYVARNLMEERLVVEEYHPAEAGGPRFVLSPEGEKYVKH